jgi:voltage-gated potassium channel
LKLRGLPTHRARRRAFVAELGRGLRFAWPVLSAILLLQLALGMLAGFIERWSIGDTVYFTFITGLTIGYGDLVPRHWAARLLAVVIGLSWTLITGLIVAIAVRAMQATLPRHDGG